MKIVIIFAAVCTVWAGNDKSGSASSNEGQTKRHLIGGDWDWHYPWNYHTNGYYYPDPHFSPPEENFGREIHSSTVNLTPVILIDEDKQTIKVNFAAEVESSRSFVILPFEDTISAPIPKNGIQTLSFDLVINHNNQKGLSIAPKVSIKDKTTGDLNNNADFERKELDTNEELKEDYVKTNRNEKLDEDFFKSDINEKLNEGFFKTDRNGALGQDYLKTDRNEKLNEGFFETDRNGETGQDYLKTDRNEKLDEDFSKSDRNEKLNESFVKADSNGELDQDYLKTDRNEEQDDDYIKTDSRESQYEMDGRIENANNSDIYPNIDVRGFKIKNITEV